MFDIKTKEIRSAAFVSVLLTLFLPALTLADTTLILAEAETGSVAARQAADQKAALAKKRAEKEAKLATEANTPSELKAPEQADKLVNEQKGK